MVKKGSLIKTAIGQIEILDIVEVSDEELNEKNATEAGYGLDELKEVLNSKEGTLFKISLRYHSEDPRIALRNKTNLSKAEFKVIEAKLNRLDQYSKQGDWTLKILQLIQENPKIRAADLAEIIQMEKQWLKTNIRKLKNLGLTISHEVGYSLSPLGEVVLEGVGEER